MQRREVPVPKAPCKIMRLYALISATVVFCGAALAVSGCASDPKPDTVVVRENYVLKSKSVEPANNGISRFRRVEQPVLVELDDAAPGRVARPVEGSVQRWAVYEKPFPTPSYTEAIAGAGINNGIVASVYFPRNKSETDDLAELNGLVQKLKSIAGPLTVIGYTDVKERRSSPGVGLSRAKFVAEKLEELGVPADRIKVKNGGATRVYHGPEKDRCVNIVLKVD